MIKKEAEGKPKKVAKIAALNKFPNSVCMSGSPPDKVTPPPELL